MCVGVSEVAGVTLDLSLSRAILPGSAEFIRQGSLSFPLVGALPSLQILFLRVVKPSEPKSGCRKRVVNIIRNDRFILGLPH